VAGRAIVLVVCAALAGCASMTNPVGVGIPAPLVPPELLMPRKDVTKTIPLSWLGQPAADVYRLEPGDVLGVWIDGVLGRDKDSPNIIIPTNVAPPILVTQQRRLNPGAGYPITVTEDGTIQLPLVSPIPVRGLSVAQAQETIRRTYVEKKLLGGSGQMLVTLLQPHHTSVVVLRQEAVGGFTAGTDGVVANTKRGLGYIIELPPHENDVLHALGQTGGMPALEAYDEVVIFRGCCFAPSNRDAAVKMMEAHQGKFDPALLGCPPGSIVRIPLRQPDGAPPPFKAEDVILRTGDVVFIDARDRDLFFSAGLLPAGEHILPRDHDLDVVEAIARIRGPLVNGGFATSNLSGQLRESGIGAPSPSLLTVLRKMPGGGRLPIHVDLNRAFTDKREAILVAPGDVLVLQEQPSESFTRYMTQTFFNFTVAWEAVHSRFAQGLFSVATPDRVGGGTITTNFVPPR
jgi:hypothetical protein